MEVQDSVMDKILGYWSENQSVEYYEGDIYVGGKSVDKNDVATAVYKLGVNGKEPELLSALLKALEQQAKDEADYRESCRESVCPDHEELIGFLCEPLRVLCGNMKGERRMNEADICMVVGLMNNWFEARARNQGKACGGDCSCGS